MDKRPFIIDCDPGIDDAVAIFLAASCDAFDIRAITSVAGNVDIDLTTRNALDLCHVVGLDTIVARGAARPMMVEPKISVGAHGATGLGTVVLERSPQAEAGRHAWDVIYDEAVKAAGELEIIAMGPLANLGILLTKYPDAPRYIKKITIMGGSRVYGNSCAYGEYNVWADPLASDIVFRSDIPMAMVGLETIFRAKLTSSDWEDLFAEKNHISEITREILRHKTERGEGIMDRITARSDDPSPLLCDCMTVACVVDPSIAKFERRYVCVETADGPSRGRTIIDWQNRSGHSRNCEVAVSVDRAGFKAVMQKMFAHYSK